MTRTVSCPWGVVTETSTGVISGALLKLTHMEAASTLTSLLPLLDIKIIGPGICLTLIIVPKCGIF